MIFIGLERSLDVEWCLELVGRSFALKIATIGILQSVFDHLAMEFLLPKSFGYVVSATCIAYTTSGRVKMAVNCFDLVFN